MFSPAHIAFILLSAALIAAGVLVIRRTRPSLDRLIKVCFVLGLISEAVKVFCVIEIMPVVEPVIENGMLVYRQTGAFAPYLQAEHLPLELCSLQLVFMLLVIRRRSLKRKLLALMYATALVGGVIAILLSSIAPEFKTAAAFFSAPRAWQFFLYHAMIVTLGIAIGMDREYDLHFRDLRYALLGVLGLDFIIYYVNSIMSVPYYQGDTLMGIAYAVNYFSSYNNPLGIVMSSKAQYALYLLIRLVLAVVLIVLVFVPFAVRDKKEREVHVDPE